MASRPGRPGTRSATFTPIHGGQRAPVGGSDSQAVLMRMRAYVSGLTVPPTVFYEMFLVSAPLNAPGGIGSPANAVAIK